MEKKIKPIFIGIFFLVTAGCGSGSGKPPEISTPAVSPPVPQTVTKSVLVSATLPENLKTLVSQLVWSATLKGQDSQGKALGALGPIVGEAVGSGFQFVFPNVPPEMQDKGTLFIELSKSDSPLNTDCRLVSMVSQSVLFKDNRAEAVLSADSFDTSADCDGDGVSNLIEFLVGLRVDSRDTDGDGVGDGEDIFPVDPTETSDEDMDFIGDNADNCPATANTDQTDIDQDKIGDACDPLNNLDNDADGIVDLVDNCPVVANADQADFDRDGVGDACDNDIDGDELTNEEENTKGKDGVITDPKNPDTDGDGILDGVDNCSKVANYDQKDGDGDSFGDACDCAPNDKTIHPTATDDPDSSATDSNCDGIDGDREKAVFVTSNGELVQALAEAKEKGKDIYVGAGTYRTDDLLFPKGLRLYGGYQTASTPGGSFGKRDVNSADPLFATRLVSDKNDVTIYLQNISEELLLDGFHISNNQNETDPVVGSRTVVVDNSRARFTNNVIQGSNLGTRTNAVTVLGASHAVLQNNWIDAGSGNDASTAVMIDTADDVTLEKNVILGGDGRFAMGVDITGASPKILNNTIDATSHFSSLNLATAQSLRFENALGLEATNNIFITGKAANQYGVICVGLEPVAPEKITGNLFASFDTNAGVRAIGCRGDFDFEAGDGLVLGVNTAAGNLDYDKSPLSQLLDITSYHIVDTRYQNKGALR
ncbi:MAG: thrombospondin type 3 repeat-containing protein [Deltaproteobacteria bacterium]|nr:thrombospondin type 3 repeat-containing protein [Deltaproteobacteria bacterium]